LDKKGFENRINNKLLNLCTAHCTDLTYIRLPNKTFTSKLVDTKQFRLFQTLFDLEDESLIDHLKHLSSI